MIFRRELAVKVMAGIKTVTRRKLSQGMRYHPHMDYAVQPGRGRQHIGHVMVLSARRELLAQAAASGEAEREGFASYHEFRACWRELHGGYDPEMRVVRIEFRLLDRCSNCVSIEESLSPRPAPGIPPASGATPSLGSPAPTRPVSPGAGPADRAREAGRC